jgi:DNA-binding NarL/FixJ family response regulator
MIRVLLADDHTLVRAGIRSLLEKMAGIQVIGEASDGREALELIKKTNPNVVLLDVTMPGMNGLDITVRVVRDFPHIKVIILSMHANEEYVLRALKIGVSGYLLKDAATTELELALKAVDRGETYLSPAVSKKVINNYLERVGDAESSSQSELTPRQREILQLIAEGKSTKEIAFMLSVSIKTVEAHRSQLMDRIGIHDVPGLVRYAIRIGLVTSDK